MDVNVPAAAEGRVALARSFAGAARRYWLSVFPRVCLERRHRRARALQIPDPLLRATALDAQRKWGNVEGAAAFAAFVPARHRAAAARAMTCYQAAYNYLDMLGEQPSAEPAANGRRLHSALLVALDPGPDPDPDPGSDAEGASHPADGSRHPDYYEHHPQRNDGGYLTEIVDACRAALATLPSYPTVAPAARAAAERIVAFQSANTGERSVARGPNGGVGRQGDLQGLERWARAQISPESDLRWWETAAAAGSSLCVYALIALAAEPDLAGSPASLQTVAAVQDAYFPWIGALHSLLDNLVDAAEDRATGQHSLIECYACTEEAAARMGRLAERSLCAARALPDARAHTLLLAAMASFYLSTPEAATPRALPIARAVLGALDGPADLAMLVFRTRLRARGLLPGAEPGATSRRRTSGAEIVMPAQARQPEHRAATAQPARPVPRGETHAIK